MRVFSADGDDLTAALEVGHPAGTGAVSTIEHLARHGWYATSTQLMDGSLDGRLWMAATFRGILPGEALPEKVRTIDRSVSVHDGDGGWSVHVTVHAVTLGEAFRLLDAECARVDGEMAGDGIGGTA